MKILIMSDSFKGSLTSSEAGKAISEGIKKALPYCETEILPVADGGEGTVDALTSINGSRTEKVTATDPLGRKIECTYGIIGKNIAVIEISAAAGLTLLKEEERNPMLTTTYGAGEIIKDAVSKGCRDFIIGLGGSATNDGGAGMLQALGFSLRDSEGRDIPYGAEGLKQLHKISAEKVIPEIKECRFRIACDVTNPLYGDKGCSRIFAKQKGADESMTEKLEELIKHFSVKAKELFPDADENAAGAGAAGGLGFAFMTFLKGEFSKGIDLILDITEAEERIISSDIIVTGEGRLDSQTVMGKAPVGIARLAKKHSKKVIAFCGSAAEDAVLCNKEGIDAFFPILREITDEKEAMKKENAFRNLSDTAEQVFRAVNLLI